jgi:hypothetical protein
MVIVILSLTFRRQAMHFFERISAYNEWSKHWSKNITLLDLLETLNVVELPFLRIQILRSVREQQMLENAPSNIEDLAISIFFVEAMVFPKRRYRLIGDDRISVFEYMEIVYEHVRERAPELSHRLSFNCDNIYEFLPKNKWNIEQLDELCRILEQLKAST